MKSQRKLSAVLLCVGVTLCVGAALSGCGGGGGSSSGGARSSNSKARIIATTRVSRAILAVTGLGRTITRAATPPAQKHWSMGARIPLFFTLAANSLRSATPPPGPLQPQLDPGTGLYYTTTVQPDGSGEQLLFLDSAMTMPAGYFKWLKPQWAVPQPPTYPAIITVTYSITAGNYKGVSGTMRITVNDPNFKNGLIELALTDSLHESASASLNVSEEGIAAKDQIDLPNGDSCTVDASTDSSGTYDQVFTWPDGGTEDIFTQPDGTSTETYTNPDSTAATPDLSGTVQPDGSDTINNNTDGSSETVNVDPGSDDSSGDSSSGDSSGDSGGDSSRNSKSRPAILPRRNVAMPRRF